MLTIKEIKARLKSGQMDKQELMALAQDQRAGVKKLLASRRRKQAKQQEKKRSFLQRLHYEQRFWRQGKLVAGVDEVGRGPLAGPVVTAAVIIDQHFDLLAVNDSKQLSPQERLALYPQILKEAMSVAIGLKGPAVIDQVNIYQADRLAMAEAVHHLDRKPDALLVDAMQVPVNLPQISLIKGDSKSVSIGAASIVAKVFRDQLMADYAHIYPQYGFEENAGYGTKQHLAALAKYGSTPIHRQSFAPVRQAKQRKK